MSLTVKVYLWKAANDQPEIRRFVLYEQPGSTYFEGLTAKIRQIFPGLASTKYTLSWKGEYETGYNTYCEYTNDPTFVKASLRGLDRRLGR